jgi:hypothetical protein
MEYLGLIFEIIFLAIGVYLYLFVRGFIKQKDPKKQAKMDDFRKENGWWLRLAAIALIAVMTLNVALHIQQLLT